MQVNNDFQGNGNNNVYLSEDNDIEENIEELIQGATETKKLSDARRDLNNVPRYERNKKISLALTVAFVAAAIFVGALVCPHVGGLIAIAGLITFIAFCHFKYKIYKVNSVINEQERLINNKIFHANHFFDKNFDEARRQLFAGRQEIANDKGNLDNRKKLLADSDSAIKRENIQKLELASRFYNCFKDSINSELQKIANNAKRFIDLFAKIAVS